MEQKRWSQSDLARELGEHRNWVIKRLSGETDLKAEDLPRLADALQISPCAFFEEVRPAPTVIELSDRSIDRIGEVVAEKVRIELAALLAPKREREVREEAEPFVPTIEMENLKDVLQVWQEASPEGRRILESVARGLKKQREQPAKEQQREQVE